MTRLLTVTAVSGFAMMACEVLTLRAFAALIGTSTLATSCVIAMVVLALSLGYFLAARVRARPGTLVLALVLAALSLLLAPFTLAGVKALEAAIPPDVPFLSRVFALGSFAVLCVGGVPCIFLGMASPLLFARVAEKVRDPRIAAARTFIWGGIGSLAGTLLSNLALIPAFGVNRSFALLGFLLFGAAALMVPPGGLRGRKSVAGALGAILLAGSANSLRPLGAGTLAVYETRYQTIYVKEVSHSKIGTARVLAYDTAGGFQSIHDPGGDKLPYVYFDEMMVTLGRAAPSSVRVLVLGSAGGTLSSYISKFYGPRLPGLEIVNVDIDPVVHEIAREYFGAANAHTRFVTADARMFVKTVRERYDLVAIDLYSKGLYVPSEVLTAEFAAELSRIVAPRGAVTFNVSAPRAESRLVRTLVGSLQQSFAHVYLSDTELEPGGPVSNFLVTASRESLDFRELSLGAPAPRLAAEYERLSRQTVRLPPSLYVGHDDDTSSEWLSAIASFETSARP